MLAQHTQVEQHPAGTDQTESAIAAQLNVIGQLAYRLAKQAGFTKTTTVWSGDKFDETTAKTSESGADARFGAVRRSWCQSSCRQTFLAAWHELLLALWSFRHAFKKVSGTG